MELWEQERREVLESVLDALAMAEPDDDRDAACLYLLRRLAQSGRFRAPPVRVS